MARHVWSLPVGGFAPDPPAPRIGPRGVIRGYKPKGEPSQSRVLHPGRLGARRRSGFRADGGVPVGRLALDALRVGRRGLLLLRGLRSANRRHPLHGRRRRGRLQVGRPWSQLADGQRRNRELRRVLAGGRSDAAWNGLRGDRAGPVQVGGRGRALATAPKDRSHRVEDHRREGAQRPFGRDRPPRPEHGLRGQSFRDGLQERRRR